MDTIEIFFKEKGIIKKILTRPRLINLIAEHLDKEIIIIHGEPGIGKTTLILDYVQSFNQNKMTLWYNFRSEDNKPQLLLNNFYNIINKNNLNIDLNFNNNLFEETLYDFFESNYKKQFSLVFDDFHKLRKKETIQLFINICNSILSDNVKLIIVSRQFPELLINELKNKRDILIIDGQNLSFTINETISLYNRLFNLDLKYR